MKIERSGGRRTSAHRWGGRLLLVVAMLCIVLVSPGRMRVEAQAGTGGQGSSGLTIIEVKPHLYMITGAGSNVAVHIGRDGVIVTDTGTAEKAIPGGYSKTDFIASFIGFAPARNPRLLVAVMVDTPRGSYYGGVVAAPVFQKIVSFALPYLRIPPG